jgi:hypothetical protein
MAWIHPDAVEYRRRQWMRPDADRYLKPPPFDRNAWLKERRAAAAEAAEARGAIKHPLDDPEVRRLVAEIKLDNLRWRYRRKYRPDQPRVPAGDPDGGQWTSEGGGVSAGGGNDPEVVSERNNPQAIPDATPENPWASDTDLAPNVVPVSDSSATATPTDVVLPGGSKIPDPYSPTGYLRSPVADLSHVAQAGSRTGSIFRLMLDTPRKRRGRR